MDVDEGAAPTPQLVAESGPAVEISSVTDEVWRRALDRVVPAVVVLKVTLTRAVDTEAASSAYATGFIVDKARGIILTNRHVITPGPIVAEAIFLDREEVPVLPIYYDPVHDFGFLRFDPSKIQFMELEEVPLAPEAAAVGREIRVVGNDSGEKVSILAGVLARLDRDAPVYGRKSYNDFNTFYLQAASGTKGGSSGSPVVDCQGRAVGLNAGGKNKAASAYYLPLERVVRALKIIQADKDIGSPADQWKAPVIPRGDLQTTFLFKGFDEVRRLGLQEQTERAVRAVPARAHGAAAAGDENLVTTGMLVVDTVLPGGPADGLLEAGDVMVSINGSIITHFLGLEEVLDAAVGQEVHVMWERGKKPMEARIKVGNLHDVTPASFLEVSGGTVQALSYQQARNNRVVTGQVYVAEPGYMLGRASVPKHAIITALAGQPTPSLEVFARVLRGLPHGSRVPVEFFVFTERHRRKSVIMHMDRQWYGPPLYWTRDDAAGCWHPTTDWPPGEITAPPALPPPAAAEQPANGVSEDGPTVSAGGGEVQAKRGKGRAQRSGARSSSAAADATKHDVDGGAPANDSTALSDDQLEERLRCSMVLVDVDIPLVALSDGVHARSFAGNGLVVYHGQRVGLVLVDRNTVVVGPCDVNLSFGAHPTEISGTVRFLHPLHNFALVSYDPAELPEEARAKVQAAVLLPRPPIKRGDTVVLAGLTKFLRVMQRKSTVTTATSAITISAPEVPRFRAVHEEVIKVDQDFGATFSGVLTDEAGRVRALWGSYAEQIDKEEREWCSGLPTDAFYPWVQLLRRLDAAPGAGLVPPAVRTLDAELEPLLLSKAAQHGLPGPWVVRLDQHDPERRQVLRVRSTVANSHAAEVLRGGDMLLAVDGRPVTCFRDVEAIILAHNQHPELLAASGAADPGPPQPAAAVANGSAKTPSASGRKRGAVTPASGTPARKTRATRNAAAETAIVVAADAAEEADAGPGPSAVDTDKGTAPAPAAATAPPPSPGPEPGVGPTVAVTVFRGGQVLELQIRLGLEDGMSTHRLVHWCGAQLQSPHRAVRELGYLPDQAGVYISRWHHGSPAHRYGLYALHWITEVNGVAVPDLDAFLKVVQPLGHGDFVRVKVCHLETAQSKVLTLKMDLIYWPTWELTLEPETCHWKRRSISAPVA